MNKLNVFTMARHTKHTDVKDVTLVRIKVFDCLIVVREKNAPSPSPMGPCVLILSISHGVHTESLPLVVASGGIDPSILLQTRESQWRFEESTLR